MKQERNYGIDLLRIVAIYMILILHILGQGGVLKNIWIEADCYEAAWTMELMAYCAVNCYALISGYVGLNSRFKLSNLFLLWGQVVFISVASLAIFACAGTDITGSNLLHACLPVASGTYWYFTAYFCLYLLTPFINKLIQEMSGKALGCLSIILLFLFSFMPTVLRRDMFLIDNGYSPVWLGVLYIFGAILGKYKDRIRTNKWVLLGGYVAAVAFTVVSKFVLFHLNFFYGFTLYDDFILIRYNSPTMVIAAVCLLLLFANLNVKKISKVIKLLAPATFGVYIIHTEPFIWEHLLADRFYFLTKLGPLTFVPIVIGSAFGIYLVCTIIELVRMYVFKLCRIPKLCKKLEEVFRKVFIPLMLSCGKKLLMGGNRE